MGSVTGGSLGSSLVVLVACGGNGGSFADQYLQSDCVHANIPSLERTLPDGEDCSNFAYGDCTGDPFPMASDCVNYCGFDVCQAAECVTDEDCVPVEPGYECLEYVVSGDSYGHWCGEPECPKGRVGCPCRPGGICVAPDDYWVVECNAQNLCVGSDTCPYGCRSGSLCCGGAFCGGDCIGTPCC